jgi:hypothetical protein
MEVFSDSGNSFGKVPLLCRYAGVRILMQVNVGVYRGIDGSP